MTQKQRDVLVGLYSLLAAFGSGFWACYKIFVGPASWAILGLLIVSFIAVGVWGKK